MSKDGLDLKTIRQLQEDFKNLYEQKLSLLSSTYQTALQDLKKEYQQLSSKLENSRQLLQEEQEREKQERQFAIREAEREKNEAMMERQKLALEQKKLQKIQVNLEQSQKSVALNSARTPGGTQGQSRTVETLQKFSSTISTHSSSALNKKKAADFYFQNKKSVDNSNQKNGTKDFLTKDVSPVKQPASYKPQQTFTYDQPEDQKQMYKSASYEPSPKIQNASVSDQARKKLTMKKESASKSPMSRAEPINSTTSPLRKVQTISKPLVSPSTLQSKPVDSQQPELPQKLIDEFQKEPQNFEGLLNGLHDPEMFASCLAKWKQAGAIFAKDIIKNAPSHCPIDYHLRVSENDIRSGFGQVDRNCKLQGIGREVQDFIYEGQFKDNLYHGWGRYICSDGIYWGFFNNGLRHGFGKFVSSKGETKEGNWNMGQLK